MKIISHRTKIVHDLYLPKHGENKMACPTCSKDRKKTTAKVFSFNTITGLGNCIHCEDTFAEYKPYEKKKEYKVPEPKNNTALSDKALSWFTGRMISQQTLIGAGVYSDTEWMPQEQKDCSVICFPYIRDGQVVNIKYRDAKKNFKLFSGAELVLYNLNSILEKKEAIITEGEIDCLSCIESGLKCAVSVPNGSGGKNLDYIDNCYDVLSTIEKFVIATDGDVKGVFLRDELIRRLGAEKCYTVDFGDCKDANEYLIKYSAPELRSLIENAKPVPVKDIVSLKEIYSDVYAYYQSGLQPGAKIFTELDNIVTWETGRLGVVTGIPSHGKSTFLDFLVARLNQIYGWRVGICSPENFPIKIHVGKIMQVITGKSFDPKYLKQEEYEQGYAYISENYHWIMPESDMNIENIIAKAKLLVNRFGIRILILDPYNKFEHTRDSGESKTDYVSRLLDRLAMFAIQNNCLVFLVAHPTKMKKKEGGTSFEIPTLYDISDSAHFYNKADYGVVIYRNYETKRTEIHVPKVRFMNLGTGGNIQTVFNALNLRYETPDSEPDYKTYIGRNFSGEIHNIKPKELFSPNNEYEEPNF